MHFNNQFSTKFRGPVRTVVETLVVADLVVFKGFLQDSQIKNVKHVFKSMEIYYSHLINSVRYEQI